MSLKVKNLKDILEEYAPLELKQSYDNVGLMVEIDLLCFYFFIVKD